jgi:hypothetical protein
VIKDMALDYTNDSRKWGISPGGHMMCTFFWRQQIYRLNSNEVVVVVVVIMMTIEC